MLDVVGRQGGEKGDEVIHVVTSGVVDRGVIVIEAIHAVILKTWAQRSVVLVWSHDHERWR